MFIETLFESVGKEVVYGGHLSVLSAIVLLVLRNPPSVMYPDKIWA